MEVWGITSFALGWMARPTKRMNLDRPVTNGDRFSLEKQKSAVRMGPYMRKGGIGLMIVGALMLVVGLVR